MFFASLRTIYMVLQIGFQKKGGSPASVAVFPKGKILDRTTLVVVSGGNAPKVLHSCKQKRNCRYVVSPSAQLLFLFLFCRYPLLP